MRFLTLSTPHVQEGLRQSLFICVCACHSSYFEDDVKFILRSKQETWQHVKTFKCNAFWLF